jgi:hypothetical protein
MKHASHSDIAQNSNITQFGRADEPREFTGLFLPSLATDDARLRVMSEIVALGLERNAWELDSLGYTVLMPDKVGAPGLADRMREKLLDYAEADLGVRPELETDERLTAGITAIGRGHFTPAVLFRDLMFEQAVMTRSALALITYMLGENCVLSSTSSMLKVRAPEKLELHSDQVGTPAPFPPYAQVANATWALTDYSSENGATVFVPGSHKLCRHPTTAEALDPSLAVPVSAPSGSIVIWHGNTWHGALARTRPGARLSMITLFCRWYIVPQIPHSQLASAEMLARNPERFATLMGKRTPYSGLNSDGTKIDFTLGQASQFA